MQPVVQPDHAEGELHPLVAFLLGEPGEQQRQLHVLIGGEHRQQVQVLEHEPDVFRPPVGQLARSHRAHFRSGHPDAAAGGLIQSGEQVEQGGLARPRRAHQRGKRSLGDVEREAGEDLDLLGVALEDFVDVTDFN